MSAITTIGGGMLVLPNLRVDDVNAAPNSVIVGCPGPTAVCGFVHALGRKLGNDITLGAAAFIVHSFSIAEGHPRFPADSKKAAEAGTSSMLDMPSGRLSCSLVVSATGRRTALSAAATQITRLLRNGRFAGGVVASSDAVVACEETKDTVAAVKALPKGTVLRDRSDMLSGEDDKLEALLDAVGAIADGQTRVRRQTGWIVPLAVGYRAISPMEMRAGGRLSDGVLGHVWAEDATGLGEWISMPSALRSDFADCFWDYKVDTTRGLYLVGAK